MDRRIMGGLLGVGIVAIALGSSCAGGTEDDGGGASTSHAGGTSDGGAGGAGAAGGAAGGGGAVGGGGQGGSVGTLGTCDSPHELLPGMVNGDTTDRGNSLLAPLWCMGNGREDVYVFTPQSSGTVTAIVNSSVADFGIYFRSICEDYATNLWCVDDLNVGAAETAKLSVVAGETYYLVVEGFDASAFGAYTLTFSAVVPEGNCGDGLDNNDDGILIDCEDPSCASDAACVAEVGSSCAAALPLTPGTPQNGDTSMAGEGSIAFAGLNVAQTLACTGFNQAQANPYSYTPAQHELMAYRIVSASDHGIVARTDCTDAFSQVACWDVEQFNVDEYAYVPMLAGQPYTSFVARYSTEFSAGPYTLETTAFPLGDLEPNDAFTTASPITTSAYGLVGGQVDEDWYAVTVPADTALTAEIADVLAGDCVDQRIDSLVAIYDTDGTTQLTSNDDIGASNYCSLATSGQLAGGTYFVRVTVGPACPAHKVCRSPYRLNVSTN